MTMSRKQFLHTLAAGGAAALGAPLLASLGACDSDDGGGEPDGNPGGANCVANGSTATIGGNHGHMMTVTKADIAAAADKTYAIMGTAGHPHSVTITAAQFATLAANTSIQVTSSSDAGHTHSVSVACV